MNASGSPLATLFSSLWLCDAAGDVYVLKNLEKYIDSSAAYQQYKSYLAICDEKGLPAPPTSPNIPSLEWNKVGSKFSSITAGFEGLVCGLKDARLFIRVGLCGSVPEGTDWVEVICEAAQIAVGRDCIARKTDSGKLFVSNVREDYKCCSASTQPLVLSWNAIPVGGLEEMLSQQNTAVTSETFKHFLLDENDRLFIVTDTGWVYACFEPCAEGKVTSWIKVSKPPSVPRSSIFYDLYYTFRRPKKEGFFRQVCAGRGLLWCVRPNNLDLCQLVISDFTSSEGVCELRTNWSMVTLPTDEERAVLLAASKNTVDGIYAIMKKNCNGHTQIVAFSLNQTDRGRVEIPPPSQYDPQALQIALCSCGSVSMTTPRLPRIDQNECCENGDCDFCRNAETLVIPSPSRFIYPLHSEMKREGDLGFSSMLGKRPHPDSQLPEAAIGNGSDSELLHESKRRRVDHPQLERFGLLERIDVKFIDHLANFPDPSTLPDPPRDCDSMYNYTFSLEQATLNDVQL